MSEDDETYFHGLCPRPLVTKGLKTRANDLKYKASKFVNLDNFFPHTDVK